MGAVVSGSGIRQAVVRHRQTHRHTDTQTQAQTWQPLHPHILQLWECLTRLQRLRGQGQGERLEAGYHLRTSQDQLEDRGGLNLGHRLAPL